MYQDILYMICNVLAYFLCVRRFRCLGWFM